MGHRVPARDGRGAAQAGPGLSRALLAIPLGLVLGCGGASPSTEPATPESAPTPAPSSALSPTAEAPVVPGESGPPMVVLPKGLAPLYEDFFADPDALNAFSKRLGNVVPSELPVTVEVSWSEEELDGLITLLVPDKLDVGAPVAAQVAAGGPVDPRPIQPLVGSVGAWRADLASRFDLRLLSFETRVVFWDEASGSRCWMTGPANDPDGTALNSCFVCLLPGAGEESVCRDGEAWPAPLKGSKRAVSMLGSALRPARR